MALTDEQRNALWTSDGSPAAGHRIVSARAGTGKTTMLTEYCIDLVRVWGSSHAPWQGMAVMSYTNVAKDELETRIKRYGHGSALLSSPHFVGTIDAFTNQYMFLPFGATHMGCTGRPKLVGEPYGIWRPSDELKESKPKVAYSPVFFDCYGLTASGEAILVDTSQRKVSYTIERAAEQPTSTNGNKITALKQHVWSHGYATQNDANYLAYMALTKSPTLTRSLIRRFPVLIVDEAQDMTEVQHALLDHLRAAGLRHILLVGDEYQAIYEWNTAKPKLFTAKKADEAWNPQTVRGTFRCSPPICTALTNMANDGVAIGPAAEGKNKDYDAPVQICEYDTTDEQTSVLTAIDEVAKLLADRTPHDERSSTRTIAVLGRSRAHVVALKGHFTGEQSREPQSAKWEDRHTKDYLKVIFHLCRGDRYAAAGAYETILLNLSDYDTKADLRAGLARKWTNDEGSMVGYRVALFADLHAISQMLPDSPDVAISQCASTCRVTLRGLSRNILRDIERDCQSFTKGTKKGQDQPISALFATKEDRIYFPHPTYPGVQLLFSTVHGTKGETYDGVIFYTKEITGACGCLSNGSNRWSKILKHNLVECEGKRIAYVALSRAAQILCILTSSASANAWKMLTREALAW